jgi:excisionase family DNA binding protein
MLNKPESKVQISEKLYNTKEAAALLRVSQASIRRWSDAGLLPARRIGGRHERRFTEADLVRFLGTTEFVAAARAETLQTSVNVGGVPVPLHTHLATFYNSEPGRLRLTVPFFAEGLRVGQPCFLVASGEVLERYIEALGMQPGIDIDAALRDGRLVTADGPGSDVEAALRFWEQCCWRAVGSGPTVLRITGEMASARKGFSSDADMMSFEVAFNMLARRFPMVALCQYDVRQFDGETVFQAMRAHPDLYSLHLGSFLS